LRELQEKDPEIARYLEHASFMTGIDTAHEYLAKSRRLSNPDMLETHRILFEAVYPWAGRIGMITADGSKKLVPSLLVRTGNLIDRTALAAIRDALTSSATEPIAGGQVIRMSDYVACLSSANPTKSPQTSRAEAVELRSSIAGVIIRL
jgi:hypothetical protein